jgi:hypothetical protein
MTDDICGSTDTSSGEPCQWNESERGNCPWHSDEHKDEDNTRNTLLEEQPEIKEIIVGELQAGATVPEACAEAGIRKSAYYEWRKRGKNNPESIFSEFAEETTHARRIASKQDRNRLKDKCIENDDTRTWYKLHHDQYGDTYGKEEPEERETGDRLRLGVPDELTEQWQQQLKN